MKRSAEGSENTIKVGDVVSHMRDKDSIGIVTEVMSPKESGLNHTICYIEWNEPEYLSEVYTNRDLIKLS